MWGCQMLQLLLSDTLLNTYTAFLFCTFRSLPLVFYSIVPLWLNSRSNCDITLKIYIKCFISLSSYKSDNLRYSYFTLSLYKCDKTILQHFSVKILDTLRATSYVQDTTTNNISTLFNTSSIIITNIYLLLQQTFSTFFNPFSLSWLSLYLFNYEQFFWSRGF